MWFILDLTYTAMKILKLYIGIPWEEQKMCFKSSRQR